MSDVAKIRAELELIGSEDAKKLADRLLEIESSGVKAAQQLAAGEITAKEYASAQRAAAAETRALEQAGRTLVADAERQEAAKQAQIAAEREWVLAMGASARAAREKATAEKAAAVDTYGLADAEERATAAAHSEWQEAQARRRGCPAAAGDVYQLANAEEVSEVAAQRKTSATRAEAAAIGSATAATAAATAAAKAHASAEDQAGAAAERAGKKIKGVTDDTRAARQGFVDVARATQDYAQGGFAAIVNNLEGIGRGLTAMLAAPLAMLSSLPAPHDRGRGDPDVRRQGCRSRKGHL